MIFLRLFLKTLQKYPFFSKQESTPWARGLQDQIQKWALQTLNTRLFLGFSVLRGGGLRPWSQTMVSERARPWSRGKSRDCIFARLFSCFFFITISGSTPPPWSGPFRDHGLCLLKNHNLRIYPYPKVWPFPRPWSETMVSARLFLVLEIIFCFARLFLETAGTEETMTARDVTGFYAFFSARNRAIFSTFWGHFT